MFFSVHLFSPYFLKSLCPLLRSDPLQWLPALKWNSSILMTLAWETGYGFRTVLLTTTTQPLPLTMATLLPCLTCFPICPLSHLCSQHTMSILEFNQITCVNYITNRLLHMSLDRGIWLCTKNVCQTPMNECSVIKLLRWAFSSILSPQKIDGHLSFWSPCSPFFFWSPPLPTPPPPPLVMDF